MKLYIVFFFLFPAKIVFCEESTRCHHMEHAYSGKAFTDMKPRYTCNNHKIYRRNFTVTYVTSPPFDVPSSMRNRILGCCGNCTKIKENEPLTNITELDFESSNGISDFIFPVLGSTSKLTKYGYYFIPNNPVPDYVYISPKVEGTIVRLLKASLSAVPLVVVCLLLTTVSGFISWCLETRTNKEEFPEDVFSGWFEGMWWSFISMTTVGYGDKTPRSVFGRIYAVIWILIGITLFGILTGLLTNAVMDADKPKKKELKDQRVGVLQYRIQDASVVAENDSIIVETNGDSFFDDLNKLVLMLHQGQVNGILLDKFTYLWLKIKVIKMHEETNFEKFPHEVRDLYRGSYRYFQNDTMLTDIKYAGKKQSYGMLVKDKDVYDYFHDAVADNAEVLQIIIHNILRNNDVVKKTQKDMFSFESQTYKFFAIIMGSAVFAIGLFGTIFSRYKKRQSIG